MRDSGSVTTDNEVIGPLHPNPRGTQFPVVALKKAMFPKLMASEVWFM